MLVKIYGKDLEENEFNVNGSSLKEILPLLKLQIGAELVTEICKELHYFVLIDSSGKLEPISIVADFISSDVSVYDTLIIVPEVSGELPAAAGVALLGAFGVTATATSFAAIAVTTVLNMTLAFGLNMLMSAISPTANYQKNPATTNVSNLFNNSPPIKEQGGSVPLVFGQPFCTGYLISSSLTSEEA